MKNHAARYAEKAIGQNTNRSDYRAYLVAGADIYDAPL